MKELKVFVFFVLMIVMSGCANPGTPSGGERDEDPPRITKTNPTNYSIDFDKNRIVIDFNEFVKLNDAFKNVVISPPQKKKPKVRLREKQIVIDIRDSLRPNTTYTLDFGKAIVDNNEGNPLGEYRYVFSTGSEIDRMGMAGYVKGAEVDTVAKETLVALYIPSDTLNPYGMLPDYIAQTDSMGFFMFNNIVDRAYEIIAFQDQNSNSMLDPDEPLAFRNEAVHTSFTESETQDSLQLDKYTKFKNTDLQLRIYHPIPSQQYLKDYKRPEREQLVFTFNAPRKDSLKLKFLDVEPEAQFFIEASELNDSLIYWIADEQIAKRDTLFAELSYLRTDSLGALVPFLDTLRMTFKEPKKKKKERKKKKDEEKDKLEDIDFMEIKTNMSGRVNAFDSLSLTFERPIKELRTEDVFIFTKKDTVELPQDFRLEKDSVLGHRKYNVFFPLQPRQKYMLRIDSMRVYDSGGRPNKKLETSFEVYDEAYYGKIFVTVSEGEEGVLIQLIDKKNEKVVVAEKKWKNDGKMVFDKLAPGTYVLKALWDENGNGKWDVGDYKQHRQPERSLFFAKEIELPSNWELEVNWVLIKKHEHEHKHED